MKAEKKRRNRDQKSVPRWILWLVTFLAAAVIMLGTGITVVVFWLQTDRLAAKQSAIAAINTPATINTPVAEVTPEIILQSPTPEPSPTATAEPTVVNEEVGETSVGSREELTDLPVQETAVPIITVTSPPVGSISAEKVTEPFIIDGDLNGWSDISTYTSAYRVFNQTWWDGSDDLTVFWRLGWDNINLYVSAVVIDDVHVQTQQAQTAFRGDSLELQIDTDRIGDLTERINLDDYQIILSPGDFETIAPGAFRYQGNLAHKMAGLPGNSIAVSAVRTAEGYVLEAAIPWDDIDIRPIDNMVLGVTLNANDTDVQGAAVQVVMKSSSPSRLFDQPDSWGELFLVNPSAD